MPIDYKKYPENWLSEIRPRILKRAKDCCEKCGLENKSIVWSYKNLQKITEWTKELPYIRSFSIDPKEVTVVLTIAHLDHDETNLEVKDDRLMAMCQLCHLRYDSEEKKRRNKLKTIQT